MLVKTTQNIQGYKIETLGIVFGNTVRAKHLGKVILADLKSIVGGADILRLSQGVQFNER
ncbi:MAG: heavy metal-binding domain-containing protein [Desulfobacterales bacterium]|nr:heavy metal-binding domain-containing protein [Desulfobacterales bacterium]